MFSKQSNHFWNGSLHQFWSVFSVNTIFPVTSSDIIRHDSTSQKVLFTDQFQNYYLLYFILSIVRNENQSHKTNFFYLLIYFFLIYSFDNEYDNYQESIAQWIMHVNKCIVIAWHIMLIWSVINDGKKWSCDEFLEVFFEQYIGDAKQRHRVTLCTPS